LTYRQAFFNVIYVGKIKENLVLNFKSLYIKKKHFLGFLTGDSLPIFVIFMNFVKILTSDADKKCEFTLKLYFDFYTNTDARRMSNTGVFNF